MADATVDCPDGLSTGSSMRELMRLIRAADKQTLLPDRFNAKEANP